MPKICIYEVILTCTPIDDKTIHYKIIENKAIIIYVEKINNNWIYFYDLAQKFLVMHGWNYQILNN